MFKFVYRQLFLCRDFTFSLDNVNFDSFEANFNIFDNFEAKFNMFDSFEAKFNIYDITTLDIIIQG